MEKIVTSENTSNTKSSFDYANEIYAIADYLRDTIKRSEYNRVVLPFTLLRRLECALEPTRDDVVKALEEHEADWGRFSDNYCSYSKKSFYNVSKFRLNTLGADDTLDSLESYISDFSPNAREIFYKFRMTDTCKIIQEKGMLYEVCKRFAKFDLSPESVSDRTMSDIYEHLIERYGEEIAENAEDFMTPRDVVRLAVGMIFANDDELLNSDQGVVRTLYDPTAGTGGFICDALDQLEEWHQDKKMTAPAVIVPYAQENEGEAWAMCKTNLLLRNVSNADKDIYDSIKDMSAHVMYGDTLIDDQFPDMVFSYQLSNPPYGKKWEVQEEKVKEENRLGFKGRFGAGLPSIDDGSMLFLQHVVSKMDPVDGKAGIVLSGSPLFAGDPGQGSSNIRRWLFKEDVIDCIVKLPTEIFFRTGIPTYLWILRRDKPEDRKGMIQLIDASDMKVPLRKSLGKKRYEISEEQRNWIIQTYIDGHDHGNSVLVPVTDFMFRKVTTQRPLRMAVIVEADKMDSLFEINAIKKLSEENQTILRDALAEEYGIEHDYMWPDTFAKSVRSKMTKPGIQAAALSTAIRNTFGAKDDKYPVTIGKDGFPISDPDLKDSENIPWGMDFDEYMAKEVLPYAPDTRIDYTVLDKGPLADEGVGVVGTEISFNKYFYKYQPPREPEEISAEILELENGLESFMEDLLK